MKRRYLLLIIGVLLSAPGEPRAQQAQPAQPAQETGEYCSVLDDLATGGEPALYRVRPGRSRLHFIKGANEEAGCPQANAACTARAYLLPGDAVIAAMAEGDFVCAAFASAKGANSETGGWLPRAALDRTDAAAPAARDWLGQWRAGPWKQIKITAAPGGGIELEGSALYGADDPARRERGAVNTGNLSATVKPEGGKASFSVDTDSEVKDHDADVGDATLCRVRLWRLGPYLAVTDNVQCGGFNVTFTGIYRRGRQAGGKP
jgi:hypothetical protein